MRTQLFVREGQAHVTYGENRVLFEKGKNPTPVHYLEIAVMGCIGLGVVSYLKEKEIGNPFSDISVLISNDTVKIICRCDDMFKTDFEALVSGCFVSERLAFKKEVKFL